MSQTNSQMTEQKSKKNYRDSTYKEREMAIEDERYRGKFPELKNNLILVFERAYPTDCKDLKKIHT